MGTAVVIAYAGSVAVLVALCWRATRPSKPVEQERAAQANIRVGFTDQEIEDRAFVRYVEAELKDYAAIVADLYDTTPGD